MKTVAVIGAGASGMMAALTAADNPENRVVLFERQQRAGRKLSVTGNGRCNLTNTGSPDGRYHGEDASFPKYAMSSFTPADAVTFFRKLGLLTVEEYGGRVYPLSDSANSVVDVLRFSLESRGVELRTGEEIFAINRSGNGFRLRTDTESIDAEAVIVACGGAAGAKQGGGMSGYNLLKDLGHRRTALRPALVQITTENEYPKSLKGVRADTEIKLVSEGVYIARSRGELQFTEKGISGPASFDISRNVSMLNDSPCEVHLDFLSDYERTELKSMLIDRCREWDGRDGGELFTGLLQNRLGNMVVKYSGVDRNKKLNAFSTGEIDKAVAAAKDFVLKVRGTEGFDCAQVTSGGIRTAEFNPETLESRIVPNLYACGELLDVDGDCGGFNLQWAWASGRLAGRLGK